MDVKKTFLSWPVVRQLQTGDFLGRGPAVTSERTRSPRAAHVDGRPGGAERVPLLRGGLRAARLRQGREGRPDRGRPGLAGLARTPVSQGFCQRAARQQPGPPDQGALPASLRHRVGAPRPRDGHGHDRRPVRREPAQRLAGRRRQGPARCAAPWPSPRWGERPSTTRRTTSSRSCSPRRAPYRSRTRRVFDTPPRFPVWEPRSVAAARRSMSRTWPTATASSSRAPTWPSATRWPTSG